MDDDAFAAAPFDLRYVYLAGDAPAAPCQSCAAGCSVAGQSCANAAGGCAWWGCWQDDQDPPGRYAADFVASSRAAGAIPMFTYYLWLGVSGQGEGTAEVTGFDRGADLTRYLADWRFLMQTLAAAGDGPVLVHVEPDLWGYAEAQGSDPTVLPAAVSAAGASECADEPDSVTGLVGCMLAIARAEAPAVLVGFHASAWGAGADAYLNADPGFDLAGHADATAGFLRAAGADQADFVVVEMSDRDAGFNGRWWDATDGAPPDFAQAISWAGRVGDDLGLPILWWQVPYGHEGLEDVCDRYQDNRVAYVFDHPERFAAGGALGVAFGAGTGCMTTPATDDGYFVGRAQGHLAGERPPLCGGVARVPRVARGRAAGSAAAASASASASAASLSPW